MRVIITDRNGNGVNDPSRSTEQITILGWSSEWPKGYTNFSAEVKRDILQSWAVKTAYDLKVLDGQRIVYQGRLGSPERSLNGSDSSIQLTAFGWYVVLAERRLRKRWVDIEGLTRLVWPAGRDAVMSQTLATVDRGRDRLKITLVPDDYQVIAYADQYHEQYALPVGSTVRRVVMELFARSGPQAMYELYNDDQAASEGAIKMDFVSHASVGAPATDTLDITFSRGDTNSFTLKHYPAQCAGWFSGIAYENGNKVYHNSVAYLCTTGHTAAAATEPGVGGSWGSYWSVSTLSTDEMDQNDYSGLDGLVVYADYHSAHRAAASPAYTSGELVEDVLLLARESDLSADMDAVGEPSIDLSGAFATLNDDFESADSLIQRLAAYGDTSQNTWGLAVWDANGASDGLPKAVFSARDVSSWEYEVSITDLTAFAPEESEDQLFNWISVRYTDEAGKSHLLTPDDDADLKDATSIAAYGKRCSPTLNAGTASPAAAKSLGQRYLAYHRNPLPKMSLTQTGVIRRYGGEVVPVNRVRAGERIKVIDYRGGTVYFLRSVTYNAQQNTIRATSDVPPDDVNILMTQFEIGGQ